MNKCEKCGFLHYRTDPCRKPKKSESDGESRLAKTGTSVAIVSRTQSTASRTDVTPCAPGEIEPSVLKKTSKSRRNDSANLESEGAERAGTQALPVDTISDFGSDNGLRNRRVLSVKSGETEPNAKFDRKAWMREYQRNYMRNVYRPKLKASKSNPNTPERNDE